jgi:anti-sigma B factor antagonist
MEMTRKTEGSKLTIKLGGEMHAKEAEEFKAAFHEEIEANPGISDITLDLNDLKYVPSSGLRVFLEIARYIGGRGSIRTVGVSDEVMETFDMTGIGRYLNII